eukprot:UC1_evm1s1537
MSRRKHVSIGYEAASDGAAAIKDNGILPSRALPDQKRQDNAALALALISSGTPLIVEGKRVSTGCIHDIPEGHRFAVEDIKRGEPINSWGLPFGVAMRDIAAGEYLCNSKSLATFKDRQSKLKLPAEPNFKNTPFARHTLDRSLFRAAPPTAVPPVDNTFQGFARTGGRGHGTRNYVVVMAVSSQASAYARALERRFKGARGRRSDNCDGVVCVAHTEGGLDAEGGEDEGEISAAAAAAAAADSADTSGRPNNLRKTIRTLAGFMVHPNVGAVLLVERGGELLRAKHILDYAREEGYPLAHVAHRAMTLSDAFNEDLEQGTGIVEELLDVAVRCERTACPGSALRLAQQCGGSDAFSGISANPLAGWIARALVAGGGAALLAETDELIGAESYVLSRVADFATGERFLGLVDRYYRYTGRFGHSPEGNPSGGNLYRGLYNITLKSIGAAMKKLPDMRLDHVVEYGEQLGERSGYCFMDSPGNDMESIAGQVASGCNMIMFTTGNGSITNFPFVPTIKVLTTSKRYALLSEDMDVNAGTFLDGHQTLAELGQETLELFRRVASGTRSKGERAGHHQVQLWRNWAKAPGDEADAREEKVPPATELQQESVAETLAGQHSDRFTASLDGQRHGAPCALLSSSSSSSNESALKGVTDALSGLRLLPGGTTERVGLILPTSLCSSQVASMMAGKISERLAAAPGKPAPISRLIALPHTEGCGHSAGEHETLVVRTILGYAAHPMVSAAVLLEHGCEKTHNDRMANEMAEHGIDRSRFGYTSIQLDGGIDKASVKVEAQLRDQLATLPSPAPAREHADPSALRVGLLATATVPDDVLGAFSDMTRGLVQCGATVVAAGSVRGGAFLADLLADGADGANGTLGYGQRATQAGLHLMASSSQHYVELLTGLGGTGVEVIVAYVPGGRAQAAHPLVPVVLTSKGSSCGSGSASKQQRKTDIDVMLTPGDHGEQTADRARWAAQLTEMVVRVANRDTTPALFGSELVDFQVNRSMGAVSL